MISKDGDESERKRRGNMKAMSNSRRKKKHLKVAQMLKLFQTSFLAQ